MKTIDQIIQLSFEVYPEIKRETAKGYNEDVNQLERSIWIDGYKAAIQDIEESNRIYIDSEFLGVEYLIALKEVIEVRKDRRAQYGDTYLDDEQIFLRLQIENKMKRLKLQFENEVVSTYPFKKEVALDSIKDLINYALFLLAKIRKDERTNPQTS